MLLGVHTPGLDTRLRGNSVEKTSAHIPPDMQIFTRGGLIGSQPAVMRVQQNALNLVSNLPRSQLIAMAFKDARHPSFPYANLHTSHPTN